MTYCDKKYPLCDLSIYITNELTGNSWCSTMAFKDSKIQRFKDSKIQTASPASPDARCRSSIIILNAVVFG